MAKRSLPSVAALAIISLLMAACGSTSSASSTSSSSTTTAAPVTVVKSSSATVSGKSTVVLTDTSGKTLYYFTPDSSSKAVCTSSYKLPTGKICTVVWPPLTLTSGTPAASGSLSGTLSVQETGNGRQVEYNGHPLYTFAGDTAPGQAKGQGLLGKWWVATPTLSTNSSGSSSTKSTTAPGTGSY